MNKFIAILMVTLGVATASAEDSYLWWWISDADTTQQNGWDTSWANARIKATDGSTSTYLNLYNQKTGDTVGTLEGVNYGDGGTKSYYGALVTGYTTGWTYFLEVYNEGGGWNGMSKDGLAYSEAGQYISLGGTDIPSAKFDFGTTPYTSTPEPNSAILLIIGVAALGLRRRSKKA